MMVGNGVEAEEQTGPTLGLAVDPRGHGYNGFSICVRWRHSGIVIAAPIRAGDGSTHVVVGRPLRGRLRCGRIPF